MASTLFLPSKSPTRPLVKCLRNQDLFVEAGSSTLTKMNVDREEEVLGLIDPLDTADLSYGLSSEIVF